jgi:hypothetical protein
MSEYQPTSLRKKYLNRLVSDIKFYQRYNIVSLVILSIYIIYDVIL